MPTCKSHLSLIIDRFNGSQKYTTGNGAVEESASILGSAIIFALYRSLARDYRGFTKCFWTIRARRTGWKPGLPPADGLHLSDMWHGMDMATGTGGSEHWQREKWECWKQSLENARCYDIEEETRTLIEEALSAMEKAQKDQDL